MAHDEVTAAPAVGVEPLEASRPAHLRRRERDRGSPALSPGLVVFVACAALVPSARADDQRVADLEAQLQEARARVNELEETLGKLANELDRLKAEQPSTQGEGAPAREARTSREPAGEAGALAAEHRDAVLVPDLGGDERDRRIGARPDLFLQTGFAADRVDDATADDAVTGFTLNRLEARWSGRVAERLGLGVEIQFQPATEGSSEELVNDAFVEYYANEAVTVRVGQFVKPFGFDIQQSSSERESPERAMFAGYFFPGQRDRGAMVAADLSRTAEWLNGVSVYGAVLNGNRFFDDNNDALNVNVRIRKQFEERPFAIGASFEHGSQLLPPGVVGSDRSDVWGIDAQWVFGRLGIRAEYVRGDMPSTLLSLEPEFAPGFAPGQETWGAGASFDYRFTANDQVYWRWDRLDDDPVTRANVRAFNVGYLRNLRQSSRLGFDYQWKDDVTFNDDELNTHFTIRWNVVY